MKHNLSHIDIHPAVPRLPAPMPPIDGFGRIIDHMAYPAPEVALQGLPWLRATLILGSVVVMLGILILTVSAVLGLVL